MEGELDTFVLTGFMVQDLEGQSQKGGVGKKPQDAQAGYQGPSQAT